MRQVKLIHEVRAVKSKKELANITKAQRISEKVLSATLEFLKTTTTELQTANFIKKTYLSHGVNVLAFPPIVAFRKNTANIHHIPGNTKLGPKNGANIMFDFGCAINHYCSDMTRTFFWGEPNTRQKKVYTGVLRAMELAMRKIEKGERRAKIIDKAARSFLDKKFGRRKFPHGLGHGVGTVIHEWPNFKPKSEDMIPTGCVMTIEPGLYFKGYGGVRIEDMVVITKKGYKNLTNFPKDLNSAIL